MGMTALITSAIVSAAMNGGIKHGIDRMAQPRPQAQGQAFSSGGDAVGRASVIDGDTLDIHGRRFRMFGIDAPESAQSCEDASGMAYPCGRRAAEALDRMVMGKVVTCSPRDTDQYGRTVAVCSAGGVDLNGWMVRNGQAIAYTRFTRDYVSAEAQARSQRVGIWQGRFEDPGKFRQQKKQAERGRGGYGAYGGYGMANGY